MKVEEIFPEIQALWENGADIEDIFQATYDKCGIKRSGLESMLLFGRIWKNGEKIREILIGELVAVTEGIVFFRSFSLVEMRMRRERSGFLERDKTGKFLFGLRPFCFWEHLYFKAIEPDSQRQKLFPCCSVEVSENYGAGQAESYIYLGIDEGRWQVMKIWLDRWLPEETES
ncbi:MAG: hypothetical protein Athens101428_745 [Candidatus Berkelbacteria bacterium Athens1014_28]|uniref:Uncharacterized protein n=1 Tax=Candidatus Berkelbacteria bacterium Athens1014_28 TaxID=2017145 RepID=A0A554LJR1_9BACT|nr:MAG: hypothetical protein Athens101428_745 [Candidatus Berkelbacteria bacterium Athens1014_28]